MKRGVITRWILQALLLAGVAVLPAAGVAFFHPKAPEWQSGGGGGIPEVSLESARDLMPDVVWVDARNRGEFEADHIAGAVWLYEGEWDSLLDDFLDEWDGRQVVVAYCGEGDCKASQSVARRLKQEVGVDKIVVLRGGWDGSQP